MNKKEFMPKGIKGFQMGHSVPNEIRIKLSKSHLGKSSGKKGYKLTKEQKEKISKSLIGRKFSEKTKQKISRAIKKQWENGLRTNGRSGKKHSKQTRLKMSLAKKGKKCHWWKGGISKENDKIKKSIEYRLWREAVFARDNWTCHECKIKGGKLHPHHIKSFSKYPKLRFSIDNGVTLCKNCHKKTDTYGKHQ